MDKYNVSMTWTFFVPGGERKHRTKIIEIEAVDGFEASNKAPEIAKKKFGYGSFQVFLIEKVQNVKC